MCRIFSTSLRDIALRWFTRLLACQIDNFRGLTKQFTVRFITNSRVIKGPEALTNLKKKIEERINFARVSVQILGNVTGN